MRLERLECLDCLECHFVGYIDLDQREVDAFINGLRLNYSKSADRLLIAKIFIQQHIDITLYDDHIYGYYCNVDGDHVVYIASPRISVDVWLLIFDKTYEYITSRDVLKLAQGECIDNIDANLFDWLRLIASGCSFFSLVSSKKL